MKRKDSWVTRKNSAQKKTSKKLSGFLKTAHLTPLTGAIRVPSLLSKTRDNADPAGPSPPLVLWRALMRLKPESFYPSQSNSLWTAALKMVAVTAASRTSPSNMPRSTTWSSSPSIHTHQDAENLEHASTHRKRLPMLKSNRTRVLRKTVPAR